MPQFDFANVFVPQLAWLAIFFVVLYFGIVRLTLPKVADVMQAREDKVVGDIAAAETAKAASDQLVEDYAVGLDTAHKAARALIVEAQAKATKNIEAVLAKSDSVLSEKANAAAQALSSARGKALKEIDSVAGDVAADIVERLTGKRPTAAMLTKASAARLAS